MDQPSTSANRPNRNKFTAHEVMSMLEDEEFVTAEIFLTPPGNGQFSDEDSGDDEAGGTFSNLPRCQLNAAASAHITRTKENGVIEEDFGDESEEEQEENGEESEEDNGDETESGGEEQAARSARKKRAPVKRVWRKEDNYQEQREWHLLPLPNFLSRNLSPAQLFELYFDDEVIDDIVTMTNLYASRDSGDHTFVTNKDEIRAFFTILMISGYTVLPRRTMYWERSKDCHITGVAEMMSRNRFDLLMRYLHLCDNNKLPANDKMAKLRKIYSLINERCLCYYVPSQNICVDESMIPYFGRHSSKQYIRGKPVKIGFKMWTLAADTGYIIQFEPYCGADVKHKGELGLGAAVVLDLLAELPLELPFKLYIDNFFTGLPLLKALSDKGIGATGTIRTNRVDKCPLDGKKIKNGNRGVCDYRMDRTEDILVLQWNDNNLVTIATNCDSVQPMKTVKRWSKTDKAFINIPQPNLINAYNQSMGGVDRADQNISYYRVSMRTKKWWWPLFAWLLDAMIQNAWILYKKSTLHQESPLDLLAFRRSIVNTYMLRYCGEQRGNGGPRPIATRVPDEVRLDNMGHFSVDLTTQRRCGLCGKNTRKGCSKCPVGLHQSCFNMFHGH